LRLPRRRTYVRSCMGGLGRMFRQGGLKNDARVGIPLAA
jgi:hypothetical protein